MAMENKEQTVSDIIKRQRYKLVIGEEYKSLLMRIVVFVIAGYLIFTQVFLITQNHGMGMFPAIKDGDLILAYRLQKDYYKNDVVVYQYGESLYVGRIIGRENDTISLDETGTVKINGATQSSEILFPTYVKEEITFPYTVPEGCVFILGDYRTQAEDSRDFGAVKMEDIKGKVITLLRRRDL